MRWLTLILLVAKKINFAKRSLCRILEGDAPKCQPRPQLINIWLVWFFITIKFVCKKKKEQRQKQKHVNLGLINQSHATD